MAQQDSLAETIVLLLTRELSKAKELASLLGQMESLAPLPSLVVNTRG